MSRHNYLKARLEEAFRLSPYHSFEASLRGVSEEDAKWTPPHYKGFPHMNGSIVNLAYHTGGDKHVLMSCSFGDGSITWRTVEKQFEEMGGDLAAVRRLAEDGHELVIQTLALQDEHDLEMQRPYYGGKSFTTFEVFTIVAEHDIYHAGQINYVRNLIAGSK